jgi:hypothetical protein
VFFRTGFRVLKRLEKAMIENNSTDGVIHLSKHSHIQILQHLQTPSEPIIKQTKTSQIRKSKHQRIQRTDSSDDYHCQHSRIHFHRNHKDSQQHNNSPKILLPHLSQSTSLKKLSKDDYDLKIRRKFSLGSLSSSNFDNIFNGHIIFWKLKLAAQISLYFHPEFNCIEISIYDLSRNQEMERLYVEASRLFDILEDLVDLSEEKDRKVSLSEVIKAARINCAIDFIMSHLGCEKVSFMPPAATLRYYNGLSLSCSLLLSLRSLPPDSLSLFRKDE